MEIVVDSAAGEESGGDTPLGYVADPHSNNIHIRRMLESTAVTDKMVAGLIVNHDLLIVYEKRAGSQSSMALHLGSATVRLLRNLNASYFEIYTLSPAGKPNNENLNFSLRSLSYAIPSHASIFDHQLSSQMTF